MRLQRDEDFPRVLVVGAAVFSRSSGTGITLSNLFTGWPRDRLAQLYTEERAPSFDTCEHFARFEPEYAPVEYHLFRLRERTRRTPAGRPAERPGPGRTPLTEADPGALRSQLRAQLRAFVDLTPLRVPADLRRWLREQRPEVVYATLGSVRMMRLAVLVARECGAPLVPHFMDDWPTTMYTDGQLLGLARLAVRAALRDVLRHSSYGMGISTPMAQEYERRYGLPFAAFANCVDPAEFADPDELAAGRRPALDDRPVPGRGGGDPVELVYVGGLHLDRWRSLRRIGTTLAALAGAGVRARLTIHAPAVDLDRYRAVFADLNQVRLGRSLTSDEVPAVLQRADLLVHVESFADDSRHYTRYSLSTKIPQYLAAGRPVLGFGPAELASMAHLGAARAGTVVGADDPDLLARELTRLCLDDGLRDRLGAEGLAYAVRHHRTDRVAARFAEILRQAAGRPAVALRPRDGSPAEGPPAPATRTGDLAD